MDYPVERLCLATRLCCRVGIGRANVVPIPPHPYPSPRPNPSNILRRNTLTTREMDPVVLSDRSRVPLRIPPIRGGAGLPLFLPEDTALGDDGIPWVLGWDLIDYSLITEYIPTSCVIKSNSWSVSDLQFCLRSSKARIYSLLLI